MPPHSWLTSNCAAPRPFTAASTVISGRCGESRSNKAAVSPHFRPTAYRRQRGVVRTIRCDGQGPITNGPKQLSHGSNRFHRRDRAMSRSVAKKREADREQFQKGFPGCRFRGATVIADDSPAEQKEIRTVGRSRENVADFPRGEGPTGRSEWSKQAIGIHG